MITIPKLTQFSRAYIQAALWSSSDDNDIPLDRNYSYKDIAIHTLQVMQIDCDRFQAENFDDIESTEDIEQCGHDYWLTRNGHGAGFWDGDYPEELGQRLTKASEKFGTFDLYIGDNGQIFGS